MKWCIIRNETTVLRLHMAVLQTDEYKGCKPTLLAPTLMLRKTEKTSNSSSRCTVCVLPNEMWEKSLERAGGLPVMQRHLDFILYAVKEDLKTFKQKWVLYDVNCLNVMVEPREARSRNKEKRKCVTNTASHRSKQNNSEEVERK